MQRPKVSVIMAVRNKKNIKDAVQSILDQTFKDFEFIIVEDGSDDGITPRIVDEFAEKDKRIKVIHNKKRMERCFSRNLAIEKSVGEYVAVNDGDDISLPERLKKEVQYLDMHTNCYLVGTRAYRVDEDGKKIGKSWGIGTDGDISEFMESENRLVHSSVMFRNTKKYWYRDKFLYAQDYDLFLQMLADGKEVHLIDDTLVVYKAPRDLVYSEYDLRQAYSAEMAKYIFRRKKYENEDVYSDIDTENIEQYVPEDIFLNLNMYKAFFDRNYKEARNILKKMIPREKNIIKKILWTGYYVDSFFGGFFYRIVRTLKRAVFY